MFATRKSNVSATDKTAEVSPVPDAAAGEAAAKSVAMFAQALATAQMYGVVHKVTAQMLEQGFPLLAAGLAKTGKLTLTFSGENLLVNGAPFPSHGVQTAKLARRIHALGLTSLTLNRGLGLPELEKLIGVLAAPAPSAGSPPLSAQTLRDAGLSHVSIHDGTVRMVGEGEQVVRRGAVSAALLEDARAFLQARPAADSAAEPSGENAVVDGHTLAQLLIEVGRALQPGAPQLPSADIQTILQRAARQAMAATVAAQRTLKIIENKARDPAPDTAKYKELIALISELAQELSQPLTVVNATIDMIRRDPPATGNEGQSELLAMASDSGQRLAELVTRLVQISGTPESLSPDAKRLKAIYQDAET